MGKMLDNTIARVARICDVIGGTALIAALSITIADIVLRYLGRPIVGMYEVVSMLGGLVVVFALPKSTIEKTHVTMDFAIGAPGVRLLLSILSHVGGAALLFLFSLNLFDMGRMFYESGESSMTLALPLYPVVFVIGLGCFADVLVRLAELLKVGRNQEAPNE